jgi:hypothetical protein
MRFADNLNLKFKRAIKPIMAWIVHLKF